jgi:hypothetical protein
MAKVQDLRKGYLDLKRDHACPAKWKSLRAKWQALRENWKALVTKWEALRAKCKTFLESKLKDMEEESLRKLNELL